jgi:dihydroorotase
MAFGEIFLSPSTGIGGVSPDGMSGLLGEIHALGVLATIHAEKILETRSPDLATHSVSRSPEGEVRAVEDVKGMAPTGMRLHFCHLSTSEAVDATVPYTSEVTPHHLLLSQIDFRLNDPRGKVNPPLRKAADRARLFASWDRISVLASDHAPHTSKEKSLDFAAAPAGVPGVETMIPLLLPKVLSGEITLGPLIAKTSANPCSLLGIPAPGFSPGDRADFALYPREVTTVQAENLHSRCGWTPFEGKKAVFPETVILAGRIVFQSGDFSRGENRWFPGRGYIP